MKKYTYKELRELTGEQIIRLNTQESEQVLKRIQAETKRRLIGTEKSRGTLTATADALLKNPNVSIPHSIAGMIDKSELWQFVKGKGSKKVNEKIKKHNKVIIDEWVKKQKERLLSSVKKGSGYVGRLHHQIIINSKYLNAKSATMRGYRDTVRKLIDKIRDSLGQLDYDIEEINKNNIYDVFRIYDIIGEPKGSAGEKYEAYRNIARIVNANNARGKYLSLQEIATIIKNNRQDDYFELIENDVDNEYLIDNLNSEEEMDISLPKERNKKFANRRWGKTL